ncbi:hypothetical protein MASR2M79_07470 [Aminivibrio sp.]
MKKRLAAVFLALTLSLLAVAGAVRAEKSIVIGLGSDALFMDPSQQDETITNTMGRYMYDGLLNNNAPLGSPSRPWPHPGPSATTTSPGPSPSART